MLIQPGEVTLLVRMLDDIFHIVSLKRIGKLSKIIQIMKIKLK
jgi:hypothetical protein